MLFRNQFKDVIVFKVEDDGMEPIYKQNDYVAVIKYYKNKILQK